MVKKNVIKAGVFAAFAIYVILVIKLLFFQHRGTWSDLSMSEYALFQMNLVPFKTILEYITALFKDSMNTSIPVMNLVGNFVLFMPMGLFLPYLIKWINSIKKYLLLISLILILLEAIQFITKRGAFDIDDYILNISGALIGYLIIKRFFHKIR